MCRSCDPPIECEIFGRRIRLPSDFVGCDDRYDCRYGQAEPLSVVRPNIRTVPALTEFSQNTQPTSAAAGTDAPIRVVLIFSSELERMGWGIVVDSQADLQVVGQFASFPAALALLNRQAADVALVDEAMLTPKACDAIRRRAHASWPRFLVIARHPVDGFLAASHYSFAAGFLLKGLSAADLLAAIRKPGPPH